jgi:hypothetical protein
MCSDTCDIAAQPAFSFRAFRAFRGQNCIQREEESESRFTFSGLGRLLRDCGFKEVSVAKPNV